MPRQPDAVPCHPDGAPTVQHAPLTGANGGALCIECYCAASYLNDCGQIAVLQNAIAVTFLIDVLVYVLCILVGHRHVKLC